jgi:hypothetical protein
LAVGVDLHQIPARRFAVLTVPGRVVIDLIVGDGGDMGEVTVGMRTEEMPHQYRSRHDDKAGASPQQDGPACGDRM